MWLSLQSSNIKISLMLNLFDCVYLVISDNKSVSRLSTVRWTIELMRLHNHNLSHCAWWAPLSPTEPLSRPQVHSPIQMTGHNLGSEAGWFLPHRTRDHPLYTWRTLEAMVWSAPAVSLAPASSPPPICRVWSSAVKRSIGSTTGFHNHREGPY